MANGDDPAHVKFYEAIAALTVELRVLQTSITCHGKQIAELTRLKNTGRGVLIGIALASSAGGASLWALISPFFTSK